MSLDFCAAARVLALAGLAGPLLYSLVPLRQIFDGFDGGRALAGQRVLICGASGGLGEQMAYRYADLGAHVVLVARRKSQLDAVATEARRRGAGSAAAVVGDLASEAGILAAVSSALDVTSGELDVLVLNHAMQDWNWLLPSKATLREARVGALRLDVETQVAVNFISFVKLAGAAMPALVRGAEARGASSSIVVISSGAGKVAVPKQSVYSGTKHALHGFFDSLRLEMEDKRLPVSVSNVILGTVATEQFNNMAQQDVAWPPPMPVDVAAERIIRCGAAGLEECYIPLSQFLQVIAILRPIAGIRWLLDRLTLAVSGGRNVLSDVLWQRSD